MAFGHKEEGRASLGEAFDGHEYTVVDLKTHPALDPLRRDPRVQRLVKRLGLPE
jgi:hypothetical protein